MRLEARLDHPGSFCKWRTGPVRSGWRQGGQLSHLSHLGEGDNGFDKGGKSVEKKGDRFPRHWRDRKGKATPGLLITGMGFLEHFGRGVGSSGSLGAPQWTHPGAGLGLKGTRG